MSTIVQQIQARTLPIGSAIPDDPNWSRYVPIEYRYDAWAVCARVADDLKKGQGAEIFTDLAHTGLMAGEIFGEISALFGAFGAVLAEVGVWLQIGMAYMEAQQNWTRRAAVDGYRLGAVTGANQWTWHQVARVFGKPGYDDLETMYRKAANIGYVLGILAGFRDGRVLTPNQRHIFFADLRFRDSDLRGPTPQTPRQIELWFRSAGTVFLRDHLMPVHYL